MVKFNYGRAICYSGYREGQSPLTGVYPSYEQIKEDLLILEKNYSYIRMYDPSTHAKTALKVIRDNKLKLKVILGADLTTEVYNPNCPWDKRVRTEEELKVNKEQNLKQIHELIKLAKEYDDIIIAVSCGNESTSTWNSRLVKEETLVEYAKLLKDNTNKPVTFCEAADGWLDRLSILVDVLDFISVHSYPLWQNISLDEAIKVNQRDYRDICKKYPDKFVIFTELGWATDSQEHFANHRQTNEECQKEYLDKLNAWLDKDQVLGFVFEAFDEPWKGSKDPHEMEKHWGIYNVNRKPKLVAKL